MFDEGRQSLPMGEAGVRKLRTQFLWYFCPRGNTDQRKWRWDIYPDCGCGMPDDFCNDAVITHELTVRLSENGDIQYLENQILDDGILISRSISIGLEDKYYHRPLEKASCYPLFPHTKRHQHTPNLSISLNWHGL